MFSLVIKRRLTGKMATLYYNFIFEINVKHRKISLNALVRKENK